MLYFPDVETESVFKALCLPLPKKLLPFLMDRGLNVMVLPDNTARAEQLVYKTLRVKSAPLQHMEVYPHNHPHYRPERKLIILPRWSLNLKKNLVLHEIGHAFDHLYYSGKKVLSSVHSVAEALRKIPPLDYHCMKQDSLTNTNVEQFATSFEAFFNEQHHDGADEYCHTIHDLDESFIGLMQKHFIEPFVEKHVKEN